MRIRVLTAVAVLAATVFMAVPASAAPTITTEPVSLSGEDPFTCPFVFSLVYTGEIRTITFENGSTLQHLSLVGELTASGTTLVSTEHYNIRTSTSGEMTIVGTNVHVIVPGAGALLINAGRLVIDANGDITLAVGRQQQVVGDVDAFCSAFTA